MQERLTVCINTDLGSAISPLHTLTDHHAWVNIKMALLHILTALIPVYRMLLLYLPTVRILWRVADLCDRHLNASHAL